jgi:hypothetical protein
LIIINYYIMNSLKQTLTRSTIIQGFLALGAVVILAVALMASNTTLALESETDAPNVPDYVQAVIDNLQSFEAENGPASAKELRDVIADTAISLSADTLEFEERLIRYDTNELQSWCSSNCFRKWNLFLDICKALPPEDQEDCTRDANETFWDCIDTCKTCSWLCRWTPGCCDTPGLTHNRDTIESVPHCSTGVEV